MANVWLVRWLLLETLVLVLAAGCSSNEAQARKEIERGNTAFKAGHYESAVQHFRRAVQLDPTSKEAMRLLIQSSPSRGDENRGHAPEAIRLYEEVLKQDPTQAVAVEALAILNYQLARHEEAKRWYRRAIELEPENPEVYYGLGVVNWSQSYQPRMFERSNLGLKNEQPLTRHKGCSSIREKNLQRVEEGIASLKRAVELQRDYAEAMAYLNLLYRERADIQCGSLSAYRADMRESEEWVTRWLVARKQLAEKRPGH